ncbi:MAG: uracil-DNA glycosylase [Flavobacterium sp.]|uniref:uracil-DNA glycosylase n=1 Tax=unclassified Flavobacterium TaxID=196869 RepID=UPI0012912410|nr:MULTISPECIES: uracil-DNA glycosylase [unclassified Flavobacterium]MDP5001882.1 uracil-DNA glycosylase [Flavobacterium sp.]MDP5028003.1 uracil-DNA glycosylase [Flavobacterium sp.]MQP52291.1 uracil-DNA glycosylase [Flavobacterium sp. LMO9]MQP62361.1 uracil-DNA glycosylase [Flavobacterium sp. LMO6]
MFIKNQSWDTLLESEFQKPYFVELMQQVEQEYTITTCFPPKELIFSAFEQFDFQDTKVVIIGQDPYHGIGEANGLCFSVNDGVAIPPSLKNIYTEINNEYDRFLFPTSGNLERWAKQGILLLNAGLTVRKDEANSHKHLKWNVFTDAVIDLINQKSENVVFLLWGGFAQKKGKLINRSKHLVLESGHPSPLSANRGFWFGHDHFKLTNEYLLKNKKVEIDW